MTIKLDKLLNQPLFIVELLSVRVAIITAQNYFSTSIALDSSTIAYTHYNNYLIFKNSLIHLVRNQDLYQSYRQEHWDYGKYSPTFAVLMAAFTKLPDAFGLFIWNSKILRVKICNTLPFTGVTRHPYMAKDWDLTSYNPKPHLRRFSEADH